MEKQKHRGIHRHVIKYIDSLPDLKGKVVMDVPSGDGRSSREFLKKGAVVKAFDLFPDFTKLDNLKTEYADLSQKLPVEDESIDYIHCQEGIEHVPNQLFVLEEFNRVLKKDGILIITTPNYSHLRARMANFFFETDLSKRMPPTEIDSVWFADNSPKVYFGHVFLIGVQKLQTLLTIAGFKTERRMRSDLGNTSILLSFFFYPFLILSSFKTYFGYLRKNKNVPLSYRKKNLFDRVKLNLSPLTLFNKHIFWEIRKVKKSAEILSDLKEMHKDIKD